jgi:hypothetical protein
MNKDLNIYLFFVFSFCFILYSCSFILFIIRTRYTSEINTDQTEYISEANTDQTEIIVPDIQCPSVACTPVACIPTPIPTPYAPASCTPVACVLTEFMKDLTPIEGLNRTTYLTIENNKYYYSLNSDPDHKILFKYNGKPIKFNIGNSDAYDSYQTLLGKIHSNMDVYIAINNGIFEVIYTNLPPSIKLIPSIKSFEEILIFGGVNQFDINVALTPDSSFLTRRFVLRIKSHNFNQSGNMYHIEESFYRALGLE